MLEGRVDHHPPVHSACYLDTAVNLQGEEASRWERGRRKLPRGRGGVGSFQAQREVGSFRVGRWEVLGSEGGSGGRGSSGYLASRCETCNTERRSKVQRQQLQSAVGKIMGLSYTASS